MRVWRVFVWPVFAILVLAVGVILVAPQQIDAEDSATCPDETEWPVVVFDDFSGPDPLAAYRLENPRIPEHGHRPMDISIRNETLVFDHVTGFGVAAAFRTDGTRLRDTILEADVTVAAGADATGGINWEHDLSNQVSFFIYPNRSLARIDVTDNGVWTGFPVSLTVNPDQTYRLRLDVVDNNGLLAYIDGTLVIDATYDLSLMPETAFPGVSVASRGATGTFGDLTVRQCPTEVGIDIKPGSDPNSINNDGHGVIPVAILTSDSFDAATVDATTVALDGAAVRVKGKSGNAGALEDVNSDGALDLVVQIVDTDGTYALDDTIATLTAQTYTGKHLIGYDTIRLVPPET